MSHRSGAVRVLVTDGHERAALAVVRALGQAGHTVFVCAPRPRSLAGVSRYCAGHAHVPDPLSSPNDFVATLLRAIEQWHPDVLLPMTDASLLAVLEARDRFGDVRIPFPSLEAVRSVANKAGILTAARELGIAVPRQVVLEAPERSAVPAGLRFPIVLKPVSSVTTGTVGRRKHGVRHVSGPAELPVALAGFDAQAYPLLVQERIVGPGLGVFLLLWDGREYARFSHRRIREKPPSGGVSVCAESVPPDDALIDQSRQLLARFGWQGPAMVEYKRDEATGAAVLMEVNGRFWGSLQLALDAGVDFPGLLVDLALGRAVAPVRDYRVGVRSRWWWGSVDHAWARLRSSDRTLDLPPGAPSRWRAIAAALWPWRPGQRDEVLRVGDPRPFLWETGQWLRGR